MSLVGEGIPNDAEQIAADARIKTDKQQHVVDVQSQQVADKAQVFLDRRAARKQELQEGFESIQEIARKARAADLAAVTPPVEKKKSPWSWLTGE